MKYTIPDILFGLTKTIILLILLEVFSSAVMPAMGIVNFKPAFSVLIVLFMAFKLETPILPYLILVIQYVHSVFSIEGWGIGTLAGIIVALSVRYLRDLLQFSSAISTIVVVQIFQMAWFIMVAFMLCLKMGDFSPYFNNLWRYTPESFLLSLLSPFFFLILDRVWLVDRKYSGASI